MASSAKRSLTVRALRCESLEQRSCLAASITASLTSGGVLNIEGTSAADQLVVSLASDRLSVRGVSSTFAASSVKSISITTLQGNDTVNLSGLGTAWTKQVTVVNSAGADQVTWADKSTSGLAVASLTRPTASATAAPAGDWFDSNIRDAALKSLLKSDFVDKKIDRREMLDVLKLVAKDRVVSANEFSDLTAVANNASLFTSVEYVGVLTRDVVLGNAANAKYQGAALGNLKANADAAQLEKLTGKWFLGTDHPTANYGSTNFAYANASGTLFGTGGPQYTDVHQGAVGDCYFVATLGEVAARTPAAISSMFIVNGDGTYTVRFFNNGKADYVTVDSKLPVDGSGRFVFANMGSLASATSNVLWVAMAEKAYVELNEAGWLRANMSGAGLNSYQAIAGGWFSAASAQIANRVSVTSMLGSGSSSTFDQFKTAFTAGKLIGFASKSSPGAANIVGNHQYVAVGYDATRQTVTLFNPWGINNGSRYDGLVTLSWSSVAASFSYWDRA